MLVDYNKNMGLHDIKEALSQPMWKTMGKGFKLDWIFDKTYEKIILAGCFIWSVFSIFKFVIGLIK